MSERGRVVTGALVGAALGIGTAYLFFTERGRVLRDRMEPAVDDLRREFVRFRKTLEKLGEMANDGMRVVHEFKAARAQSEEYANRTSH